jgi:hypothetical protein
MFCDLMKQLMRTEWCMASRMDYLASSSIDTAIA